MSLQQVYMQSAQEAVAAFHTGNHRQAAAKYLQAFEASPGKWTDNRWQIFHGYTSILQEEYFAASKRDFQALDRIVKDQTEASLYRMEAAFTSGLLYWIAKDREEAAAFYRDCLEIATTSTSSTSSTSTSKSKTKPTTNTDKNKKERRKKILASITTPRGGVTIGLRLVGEIMDEIQKQASNNLKILEQHNLPELWNTTTTINNMVLLGGQEPQRRLRSDGTPLPSAIRLTRVSRGPLPTDLTKEQAGHLLSVGGDQCDGCHQTRIELGMDHLKSCARCRRTFYCCGECQKKQWKAGHKQYCRKPGQVKPGDYVRLNGIESRPEVNGEVVQVVRADPKQEGRWETRIPGGDSSISIASEKMELLRPLK
jgi:hypothetical protein